MASEQTVAAAQQELQRRLDERTGELDDALAAPLVAALDAYKEALASAIDAQLACSDEAVDPAALQAQLASHLAPGDGETGTDDEGTVFVVRREDAPDPMLLVNAGFGIPCGDDNLLLGYSREDGRWVRSLDWRSKGYTEISGANGDFFRFLRLSGGQLVIAHGTPWCTSRWSRLAIDVVQPRQGGEPQRPRPPRARLCARRGGDPPQTHPGWLRAAYRSGHAGCGPAHPPRHPPLSPGRRGCTGAARRQEPDFVDEWLQVGAETAREWSDPDTASDALAARERLLALEARRDVTLNYGAVRGCKAAPERFQVEVELSSEQPLEDGDHRYLTIRQEPGGFTLLSVSDAADPGCQGPDLMAGR